MKSPVCVEVVETPVEDEEPLAEEEEEVEDAVPVFAELEEPPP